MSFLAPLFFLGAAALALPVLFHLIRRTTREQTVFSSLMFLQPSPPRLTRKSRLEHWLLLLLRCLALGLLAFGFARPFLKQTAAPEDASGAAKHIVVLLDTSASMRREGLWAEARKRAEAVLRQATPADHVAVFTFDRQVTPLLTFEQWDALAVGDRVGQTVSRVAAVTPGWASTQLGHALVRAAEELADTELTKSSGPRQVVLISDLQEGSRLEALQAYEWPKGIQLILDPVKSRVVSNAGLQLVTGGSEAERDTEPVVRVRVSNVAAAKREKYQVGWARSDAPEIVGAAVEVYVPPGQSRVVTVPAPTNAPGLSQIVLRGDEEPFDNTVFVLPPVPTRVDVLYFGTEAAEDVRQPLFFLRRALPATRRQQIQVTAHTPAKSFSAGELEAAHLIVVTDRLPEGEARGLRERLLGGKTVLFAPKNAGAAPTLAGLLERESISMEEVKSSNYAMLTELDFRHPLFAPFADPRFSDFTKIHFWKHRRIDPATVPEARVVARFDSGAPAILEIPVGRGRLLVLTSGWHPDDSQFALSSKFVPLLYALLELAGGAMTPVAQTLVGDVVPVPGPNAEGVTLQVPDGSTVSLAAGTSNVVSTLQPGVYGLKSAVATTRFAVNMDPNETRTTPLAGDELEGFGAPVTGVPTPEVARDLARKTVLQSTEAESRQKLWRWLLLAALAVLVLESVIAGWTARRAPPLAGSPA